ncbi:hypothetical protein WA158_008499 [Blastocystis sp. Blastoise]
MEHTEETPVESNPEDQSSETKSVELSKILNNLQKGIGTIQQNMETVCENMNNSFQATMKMMDSMNKLMETFVLHNVLVRSVFTKKENNTIGMEIIVSNITSFPVQNIEIILCHDNGNEFENINIQDGDIISHSYNSDPFSLNPGDYKHIHLDLSILSVPYQINMNIKVHLPSPGTGEILENTYYGSFICV